LAAAEAAVREEAARRERERLAALEFAQKEEDKARAQAETATALEEARRAKEAAEAQARARRAVESEVAEINRLMSLQRKPVVKPAAKPVVKPPEPEVKPVEPVKKEGPSGTLHKPSAQKAAESKEATAAAKPKEVSKDPKDAKDKKHLSRKSFPRVGPMKRVSVGQLKPGATPAWVTTAGGPPRVADAAAMVIVRSKSRFRPSLSLAEFTFLKQLRLPILRTRCQSKRPKLLSI
jgi:outer membrane biosynthesis protein TonB